MIRYYCVRQQSNLLVAILSIISLVTSSPTCLAQVFPITVSFENSEWKPSDVPDQYAWSIYGTIPDWTTATTTGFKISRVPDKYTYRFEGVAFGADWLHFAAVPFTNPAAAVLQQIALPVRFSPEIQTPATWEIKYSEPVFSGDTREEVYRRLDKSWYKSSTAQILLPELVRYVEALSIWSQVKKEGAKSAFLKNWALRNALESATRIQELSKFGLYFDEKFIDDAIQYADSLSNDDQYKRQLLSRIGDAIFSSWTQIGSAVPLQGLSNEVRLKYCSMNRAYRSIAEGWSKSSSEIRKRYWALKPMATRISVEDLDQRLSSCPNP